MPKLFNPSSIVESCRLFETKSRLYVRLCVHNHAFVSFSNESPIIICLSCRPEILKCCSTCTRKASKCCPLFNMLRGTEVALVIHTRLDWSKSIEFFEFSQIVHAVQKLTMNLQYVKPMREQKRTFDRQFFWTKAILYPWAQAWLSTQLHYHA